MSLEHIRFKDRESLRVEVNRQEDLPQVLESLGLANQHPVIVMVGGAGGIHIQDQSAIYQVIETIAQAAQSIGAVVIDGGTQSGIMGTMGHIRSQNCYHFPLVGVCAVDTVTWPGRSLRFWQKFRGQRAHLDPNHTHFLLVPGKNWGDESIWISDIATQMAGMQPSVALLINGGQIARNQDIPNHLAAGRNILVMEGSGRAADELATLPPDTLLMQFIHIRERDRLKQRLIQNLQINP